jgi:hypothetical protein
MIQQFILKQIESLMHYSQSNFLLGSGLLVLIAISSLLPIWATETSETLTLETLPTGQYYYQSVGAADARERGYVLLRKAGKTVIGIDRRELSRRNPCFRGFAEGDRITNATQVFPPYQPDSRLDFQAGEWMDLAQYQQSEPTLTVQQTAELQTCIEFFWR